MQVFQFFPRLNIDIQKKIALIIVASTLVTAIPSSFLAYRYIGDRFLTSELDELIEVTRHQAELATQRFSEARPKLEGLARVLQKELSKPIKAHEIDEFYDLMELNSDGVWRNKRSRYNGLTESGIFLPQNPQQSDSQKVLHLRIKQVMDTFGSAAHKRHENVWYLSPYRSEIIFDTTFPEFAFDQQADNDYTSTPWVTYTTPELNLHKKLVFTPPLFDPVPGVWMVSALYPLYLNDKWIGSLGEDMQLSNVLDAILRELQKYNGTQQFLLDSQGNFILAGNWQQKLESNPDATHFDLGNEAGLKSLLSSDVKPEPGIITRHINIAGTDYAAIGMMIEPVNWRYFKLAPVDEILAPTRYLFYALVSMIFLVSLLSGVLISTAINRNFVDRIKMIADAIRHYESGKKISLSNTFVENDEITLVAHEFDVMVDRIEWNLSETRSALKSLAESEELWKFALEGSGDAVWDWSIQTGEATFSIQWKKLLGYQDDEFPNLAREWQKHLHPDDRDDVLQNLNDYLSDKVPLYEAEFRMLCKDGSWKWILARGMIVRRDQNLQPERMVGTHADITRQKNNEFKLRRHSELMQTMLEISPIAIRITGIYGQRILFMNKSYSDLANINPDNITHQDPHQFYADPGEYDAVVQNVEKGEVIKNRLTRLQVPDLGTKWTLATYFNFEYDNQRAILGWFYDISEQLKFEESTKLHASVFDNTWEGIVISDAHNRIISVNNAFRTITGYSQQEVRGQNPNILSSGIQDKLFYQDMWSKITSRGHWRGEVWNRKKTGEIYAEMLTISAVKNQNGDITHYVGIFTDITEKLNSEKLLKQMAHYDILTGLPNRALLADRLNQEIAQCKRSDALFAVCFLDLDGFKAVNDKYGHSIGDQLLIEVSNRLSEEIRSGDTVARMGGDEFVMLLRNFENMVELEATLKRIIQIIAQPVTLNQVIIHISVSIGLTLYPTDDSDADTLLRHADISMYEAKQAGRNRFHLFDTNLDLQMHKHIQFQERIESALNNQEFCLFFQPKVNLRSGQVTGMEALIRWQHPEQGLLPPVHFLPTIESCDIIVKLGDWVINQALSQMLEWQISGIKIPVSVNLAARQLKDVNFIDKLQHTLSLYKDLDPNMLELEILETSALETFQTAEIVTAVWEKFGISFALDDFGTGYSSLSYLKQLPVKTLKIDQSFVRDMLEDREDQAIVEGVVNLAKVFKRSVVAEGVETEEHGKRLLEFGCEVAQGYGIARPMPASEVVNWVKNYQSINSLSDC